MAPNLIARAVAALAALVLLTACGGGCDDADTHTCYVEGRPAPLEACR